MNYDLAVIGAGWAGFNAAIRAKELGLKVALIEKGAIGGTCLNQGCIPAKTLIQSAKVYSLSKKSQNFGVEVSGSQINFMKIQERKNQIIRQLSSGMQFMLKNIDFIHAPARFISNQELKTDNQNIRAKFILIATGSTPQELPNLKFDAKKIISSNDILNLKEIPKSLLIIGGGVIGCEFASLYSTLGTQVSIIEKMPQLLPGEDPDIARILENSFKKKGIKVTTNTDAASINLQDFDLVLLCIGRTPQTSDLGLDKIGLNLERSKVLVDEYLRTNLPNIYAAGDATAKFMLAHYASYQGRIAAENMAMPDNPKRAENTNVPGCIFTDPQIASVGLSEEAAKSQGIDLKVNKFDFLGSGMARILDETEGLMKIVSDKKTGDILGASLIGPSATELIGILTLAVTARLKIPLVKETIFAHPTLSESILDALREGNAL